jgi:hypothetical protein
MREIRDMCGYVGPAGVIRTEAVGVPSSSLLTQLLAPYGRSGGMRGAVTSSMATDALMEAPETGGCTKWDVGPIYRIPPWLRKRL